MDGDESETASDEDRWVVRGQTQATRVSGSILEERVEWMAAAGAQHDCTFDGWGAELP